MMGGIHVECATSSRSGVKVRHHEVPVDTVIAVKGYCPVTREIEQSLSFAAEVEAAGQEHCYADLSQSAKRWWSGIVIWTFCDFSTAVPTIVGTLTRMGITRFASGTG